MTQSRDGSTLYSIMNSARGSTLAGSVIENDGLARPYVSRIVNPSEEAAEEKLLEFNASMGYPVSDNNTVAYSGLVDGGDGWLYGSTFSKSPAGTIWLPEARLGVVYRVSTSVRDGEFYKTEVLHEFVGGAADGEAAFGPLVLAADGNVYGTTGAGGANGHGTLWRIVTADIGQPGNGYELLHSFKEDIDGKTPVGLSVDDTGYVLFGAAQIGGADNQGARTSGTVFKVEIPRPPVTLDSFTVDGAATANVTDGGKVTLAWVSTNATQCTASGDWNGTKQASGEEQTGALAHREDAYTFELKCSDDTGRESEPLSVSVQVAAPPQPEPEPEPEPSPDEDSDSGGSGGSLPLAALLLASMALIPSRRQHAGRSR